MAGPLAPFGYTLNRLKPGKDGKGMVCAERTPLGAPLLAVPLAVCWTPQVVEKECAVLSEVLTAACERNPASELLTADETWITLHLLQERSRGEGATPIRRSHVALLPKVPESLLAWDDLDIEGLKGSWWYDEALRGKERAQLDFDALRLELGPAGVESLGLDKADYFWARQIVDQFGIHVLQEDGSARTLLVPGIELLQPGPSAPTGSAGARLEQGSTGSSPTLVFYAEKDYYPGDRVCLSHGGLACSNGCRLAGCGWLPESNAWDSVQVTLPLRLDRVPGERDQFGDLIQGLTDGCVAGIADAKPEAQPGECVPLGPLAGRLPVELTDGDDHVLLEVVLRFTKDRLLPTPSTLVHIGAALIADQSKQEYFMAMEKEVEGVFNNECCERRSLIFLQHELQAFLGKYPASSKESTVHLIRSEVEGALPPRSARSVRLINGERQLLADVITAMQERLGVLLVASTSPAAAPAPPARKLPNALRLSVPGGRTDLMLPLDTLVSGAAPESETALGKVLTQLGGVARALELLAARFLSASASGKLDLQEGAALKKELGVLRSCLESCPLGDPTAVSSVPLVSSTDQLVRIHSEATMAFLSAQLASLEWEKARLEHETKGSKPGSPEPLVHVLVELASVRMRLLDFEGAHADFKRALGLKPGIPQALECALSLASQKAEVLAGPASKWSGAGQILKSLRERLKDLGYMGAGTRWSWPSRVPPVKNLASDPALWSGKDSEKDIVESAQRIKPGTYITKPSREDSAPSKRLDPSIMPYVLPRDEHSRELVGLIRLFMLHKTLPLSSVKDLLGAEACSLLLKSSALTGIRAASGELLSPDEASALVPKASKGAVDEPEVFSNVLLWPASEDLLVALDFEQAVHLAGEYEPVPYLGQDSRALLLAAPRSPAASVLDACCGAGAQGLAALQGYAQKATFLDSNPRALRFACFNAYLNDLGDRCTFVEGSLSNPELPKELKNCKFDVILSSLGALPNPRMAVAHGGPSFSHGGDEGEHLLSALVAKGAQQLLAPAGRLVAVAMVPNAGGLAKRLVGWADASAPEPVDLRAVVFRGNAIRDQEYVYQSTQGCPPASTAAYLGALRHGDLRSVSQVLLLLRLPPAGAKVPKHAPRAETMPERHGLWADEAYLQAEVQGALDGLVATAMLDEGGTGSPEPLYALDWDEGEKGGVKSTVPIVRPGARSGWSVLQGKSSSKNEYSITLDKTTGTNLGAQVNPGDGATLLIEAVLGGLFKDWNAANPRLQVNKGDRIIEVNGILGSSAQLLEECKQCKILQVRLRRETLERGPPEPTPSQKGEFVADACRWKDVAMHRLLGWSPPALCDWRYVKTALPLSAKQRGTPPTGFVMAMVELKGCRCPSEVKDALRSMNCTQRYTFDGEPRTLRPMDRSLQVQDMKTTLDAYDCLVVPLETGGGRVRPLHELPVEMVHFLEAVSRYVYSTKRAIRLVMLTCGCSGPSYAGMTDDGYGVPAAAPLRGIFRCSRIENLQVPILQIDSDALVEPGRGKELVAQIDVELELSAPDAGFYKADVAEQNRAIIHTHREVVYRSGARFLPKLDLCARNPIFPGAKIPTLVGSAAEGVALITGGTGGLGILTAEALVESGVKIIVLSSRSGRISRGYQGLDARLEAMRMAGARIELEACDAKDEKQVEALLQKIRKNLGPLKWIMNAAGIVLPQDPNLMEPVFEPKCLGAWNMHKCSLNDDIKTFMMYSSMSAGAGANDLANYAAANTYIDELARLRQSQGLAAVSIMFPEVEEAGMAADTIMVKGNPANIPPGNVNATIKQIVCGKGPMAPSVAILPQGYLIPRSPTMDSMLDPLKARVDKDLWDRLMRSEASGRR